MPGRCSLSSRPRHGVPPPTWRCRCWSSYSGWLRFFHCQLYGRVFVPESVAEGSRLVSQAGDLPAISLPHDFRGGWACDVIACNVIALPPKRGRDILVTMTRKASALAIPTAQPPRSRWRLQDAKARFSELVRMAHSDGPQHVTLHGRDAVVVVDADEFNRLKGARTGELLIEALQASPLRHIEIEPRRSAMPVRTVKL